MTKQQFIDDCRNAASNIRSGDRELAHLGMLALKDLEFASCGDLASDQECMEAIKDAWQAERDYIVANNAAKQESSGPLEKCPKCGGTDFESPDGPLFISDERIEECIKCNSCGSLWWEYYDHSKTIYETPLDRTAEAIQQQELEATKNKCGSCKHWSEDCFGPSTEGRCGIPGDGVLDEKRPRKRWDKCDCDFWSRQEPYEGHNME